MKTLFLAKKLKISFLVNILLILIILFSFTTTAGLITVEASDKRKREVYITNEQLEVVDEKCQNRSSGGVKRRIQKNQIVAIQTNVTIQCPVNNVQVEFVRLLPNSNLSVTIRF